jgi:hypothetical protein
MPVATAFRVLLPNRPGEIAELARSLTEAGVNIETGAAVANGRDAYFEFQADKVDRTIEVLRERKAPFQRVPVLLAWLPNRPGELAKALIPLSEAGINIDAFYVVRTEGGQIQVAIGCTDVEQAEKLLIKRVAGDRWPVD